MLDQISAELEYGRGFALLRGLPVNRYSEAELNTLFYAIGLHMGQPVTESKGDLPGKVMNVAPDEKTPVYETNRYLPIIQTRLMWWGCYVRKAKTAG